VPAALSVRVLEVARPAQVGQARARSGQFDRVEDDSPQAAASAFERDQATPRQSRPRAGGFRWSIFGWSAAGLAFAATIAIAVLGLPSLREKMQAEQRIQLAMVTIDDRRPLTGASQARSLRSPALASSAEAFRDVNIPADLLRRAIANTEGADRARVVTQLLAYLPPGTDKADQAQVAIDSSLAQALSQEWSQRAIVPVRVYDLRAASAKAIQESLTKKIGTRPQVLLTVKQ
jgi:hypothetical protein